MSWTLSLSYSWNQRTRLRSNSALDGVLNLWMPFICRGMYLPTVSGYFFSKFFKYVPGFLIAWSGSMAMMICLGIPLSFPWTISNCPPLRHLIFPDLPITELDSQPQVNLELVLVPDVELRIFRCLADLVFINTLPSIKFWLIWLNNFEIKALFFLPNLLGFLKRNAVYFFTTPNLSA